MGFEKRLTPSWRGCFIRGRASRHQDVVQPMGLFSAWQRVNGTVFAAGTGMFNLATGNFTRTGVAVNQLVIYSTDAAAMATVRAAPGALDIAFPQ